MFLLAICSSLRRCSMPNTTRPTMGPSTVSAPNYLADFYLSGLRLPHLQPSSPNNENKQTLLTNKHLSTQGLPYSTMRTYNELLSESPYHDLKTRLQLDILLIGDVCNLASKYQRLSRGRLILISMPKLMKRNTCIQSILTASVLHIYRG